MDGSKNPDKMFVDLFPGVIAFDGEFSAFKNINVDRMSVFLKSNRLEIYASSPEIISIELMLKMEEYLKNKINANNITIKVRCTKEYSLEEYLRIMWNEILLMISSKVAVCKGLLKDSTYDLVDNKIIIRLTTAGSQILKVQNCHTLIEKYFEDTLSKRVKVEFCDCEVDSSSMEEYFSQKDEIEAKVVSTAITAKTTFTESKSKNTDFTNSIFLGGNTIGIITGKPFSDSIMKISEVTPDSGKVAIAGEVFRTESRELKSGKFIYIFDVTDYTSSVTVKMFIEKKDFGGISQRIVEGACLRIRGEAQYDNFTKEMGILAFDIVETEKELKQDKSEKKRVELHLHTQMSAMDGVSSAKALVQRAADWGHKAIAIPIMVFVRLILMHMRLLLKTILK